MRKMPTTKQIDELQKIIDNGGSGSDNVFIATYKSTTGAEIKAALAAGKIVFLHCQFFTIDPTQYYVMTCAGETGPNYTFTTTFKDSIVYCTIPTTDTTGAGWTQWSTVSNNEVFVAKAGHTTYTQLSNAYESGQYDLFIAISANSQEYYEFYAKTNTAFVFKRIEQFNNNVQIIIHTLIFDSSYPTGSHTMKEYRTLPDKPDTTNNYELTCKAGDIAWTADTTGDIDLLAEYDSLATSYTIECTLAKWNELTLRLHNRLEDIAKTKLWIHATDDDFDYVACAYCVYLYFEQNAYQQNVSELYFLAVNAPDAGDKQPHTYKLKWDHNSGKLVLTKITN